MIVQMVQMGELGEIAKLWVEDEIDALLLLDQRHSIEATLVLGPLFRSLRCCEYQLKFNKRK